MIRRPPRSTQSRSSAASDVYKRQLHTLLRLRIVLLLTSVSQHKTGCPISAHAFVGRCGIEIRCTKQSLRNMSTTPINSAPAACWACSAALTSSALLCPTCGKVQPAPVSGKAADYFQVFSLERKLAIDIAAMEREFHRLSRRLHPDRFARASPEEQQWSLAATCLLYTSPSPRD